MVSAEIQIIFVTVQGLDLFMGQKERNVQKKKERSRRCRLVNLVEKKKKIVGKKRLVGKDYQGAERKAMQVQTEVNGTRGDIEAAQCPNNNMNLPIKTEYVTVAADAIQKYAWFLA